MHQVTVRGMQLYGVHPHRIGSLSGRHKVSGDAGNFVHRQRMRCWFVACMRQGAGAGREPAAIGRGEQGATVPRHGARSLAPGVVELNTHRHGRGQPARARQMIAQRLRRGVVPQAQAARGDAAFG